MRKAWQRIFLLCMACMICMSGLCLAADDENWVEYYRFNDIKCFFYLHPSSVKIHEWSGHKFLEVKIRDEQPEKAFKVDELIAIDIENRKYICLKLDKWKLHDISEIVNGEALFTKYDKLINWVEKNRPEVINEIREYNKTAPPLPTPKTDITNPRSNTPIDPAPGIDKQPGTQVQPGGNVDVTGATGDMTPSTGFNITEDGTVQYMCRSIMGDGTWFWDDTPRFIFSRPASFDKIPGDFPAKYIVAALIPERWGRLHVGEWDLLLAFDYDIKSNTFTFYDINLPENSWESSYSYRIRVIDRNNIYCEKLSYIGRVGIDPPYIEHKGMLGYKKAPSLAWRQEHSNEHLMSGHHDNDGCIWYGKCETDRGRTYFYDEIINGEVDAALAFLAVHGQVTEAPEDFLENSRWAEHLGL